MDFTSELLSRLQEGESVENLASELTKAINEASAQNERIKAEAEAKRKAEQEAAAKNKDKIAAVNSMIQALADITVAWDLGDTVLDVLDALDAGEIVEQLEDSMPEAQAYGRLLDELHTLRKPRSESDEPKKVRRIDPIEDFLNRCVR